MIYQIFFFVVLAIIVGNFIEVKKMQPRIINYPKNTKKYTAFVLGSTGAIGKVKKKKIKKKTP